MRIFVIKKSYVFMASVAVVLLGATVMVKAAIPASDGTISACYRNQGGVFNPKGSLRVINAENGETCAANETALSWKNSQSAAGQRAYINFSVDGQGPDYNASSGVVAVTADAEAYPFTSYCVKTSFNPVTITSSAGTALLRGISPEEDAQVDQKCAPDYQSLVKGAGDRYAKFSFMQ